MTKEETDAGGLVNDVVELPEHTEVMQDTEAADEMEVPRAPEEGRDRYEPQTEQAMPATLPRCYIAMPATLPQMPTTPVSPPASHSRPRRNTKPSNRYSPDEYDLAQ